MKLTIVTLLGQTTPLFLHALQELRAHVDDWVVIHSAGVVPPVNVTALVGRYTGLMDMAALRTQASQHVREGWVFHLDTDEWFTKVQLAALRAMVDRMPLTHNCICLPRHNVVEHIYDLNWPDYRPMVHPAGMVWKYRTHEILVGITQQVLAPAELALVHVHDSIPNHEATYSRVNLTLVQELRPVYDKYKPAFAWDEVFENIGYQRTLWDLKEKDVC